MLNLSWVSSVFEGKYWGSTCKENDSLLPDPDHLSVSFEADLCS
jgi:hypothetical protein